MGTPRGLQPRSKEDILNDMATDPQYVMTESDAHVMGRDLQIAEAVFNTDFKKVKKYLRYKVLRDFFMEEEHPGINLRDNIFNQHATEVGGIMHPTPDNPNGNVISQLFLTKSDTWVLFTWRPKNFVVKVFGSLKYLCEYIDSETQSARQAGSKYRVGRGHTGPQYDYTASAIADLLKFVMDAAIADRRKWLETLESASATAKRRIAQIDY